MDTVLILAPVSCSIKGFVHLLSPVWASEWSGSEELVLEEDPHSRVYLGEVRDFKKVVQEDEWFCSLTFKYKFLDSMDSRIFYLNYTNVKFAQSVMMIIANDANIFIDNGFGTVLAGDEFIQKMNVAPDWNWRTDI